MTEGDGIRRNVARVDSTERKHLRDAIIELHKDKKHHYLGDRNDDIPGGVSKWFKQDEIHQATHVHNGPAFLTWHRELCNRFEDLLREVNRNLSLHYWDWTTNPYPLFTPDFMGNPNGSMGEPWEKAGFYNPKVKDDKYRSDSAFDTKHNNPYDPPKNITRYVGDASRLAPVSWLEDRAVILSKDYATMTTTLEHSHDNAHTYFGIESTIGNGHTAFRDPFVFLLHSNVDRLFAMWQYQQPRIRFDPDQVYGTLKDSKASDSIGSRIPGILTLMSPWAGPKDEAKKDEDWEEGIKPVRPWAPPENKKEKKTSRHISVVIPRPYDTAFSIKAVTKELLKELDHVDPKTLMLEAKVPDRKDISEAKVPDRKDISEAKVPDRKDISEAKVSEQMPTDLGLFAERLGRIEERLAIMESFIRPNERPQLGQKNHRHVENNDERQTEE